MRRVKRWIGKRKMSPPCTILSDHEALAVSLILRRELREGSGLSADNREAVRKVCDALNSSVIIRIEVENGV